MQIIANPSAPSVSAIFIGAIGLLADPEVVEFVVTDAAGEQVLPDPEGPLPRAVLDVRPAPIGARLSLGRYVATWPKGQLPPGRYRITWWYRALSEDLVEFSFSEEFELLAQVRAQGPAYTFLSDMREELGCSQSALSDARLHQKIVRASLLFEQYTGRSFTPTYKTLHADGRGHVALSLAEPIIAIEDVFFSGNRFYAAHDGPVRSLSRYRVYNRHITERLAYPDDRDNPRIELVDHGEALLLERGSFSGGQQNVLVRGVFGYTDVVEGGPPAGQVPELVQHAVRLLVYKDLPALHDVAEREDRNKRWKLTSESTRDQSYGMLGGVDAATRGSVVGGTTGDPEIDNIIILYRRGANVGAA